MSSTLQQIEVASSELRAVRLSSVAPYAGVKENHAICRFEAGRSEFWMHGRVWSGRPGTLVVQRPGDVHRDVTRRGPVAYQIVFLPARLVERVRLHACLEPNDVRGLALHRLHDAIAAGADSFALDCAVTEALGALRVESPVTHEPIRPVRRALGMIRERLADALTLDELAAHAGLDKFHLCRAFRAQVGMPPHTYLTRLRVMRAKHLLAAGARPKDVATQVGFYDQSQLHRHFRRIVGMTPGDFARRA